MTTKSTARMEYPTESKQKRRASSNNTVTHTFKYIHRIQKMSNVQQIACSGFQFYGDVHNLLPIMKITLVNGAAEST